MPGIASDIAERLWLAELWLLEKWETVGLDENGEVPDVHTDQEKKAIDRLAVLRAHVDTVPVSELSKTEELRGRVPHIFEKVTCHSRASSALDTTRRALPTSCIRSMKRSSGSRAI